MTFPRPRLNIIMPCSRRWNLPRLFEYYEKDMLPHSWEVRWLIGFAGPEPDEVGINKTNELVGMVKYGWLFMMSDDCLHSPLLFRRLEETIEANPNAGAVVFGLTRFDGSFLDARPDHMVPGYIDASQTAWKKEFLGDDRYNKEAHGYCADGHLAQRMYAKDPSRFVFVDERLIAWNNLRP